MTARCPAAALALLLAAACGDDHMHGDDDDDQSQIDAGATDRPVTVAFAAEVGDAAFVCGQSYDLGTPPASYTVKDLRLYVHDVRLLSGSQETPLTLDADGEWQFENVALLDFEDATAACAESGTAGTHTALTGTVPASAPQSFDGIRFVLGLPADKNHGDPAAAAPPLDVTSMFWVWRAGYKFVRLDGVAGAGAAPFLVHLGSTGCTGATPTAPPDTPCATANRVEVTLTGFDPAAGTVVVDVAALLSGSDVTANTPNSAPGCMSDATDPECPAIFDRLGLGSVAQSFFRAE